ncbi:MAG: hypothetical protein JXA96_12425 [Sedimentisphaerales bacterium]|nr:hypothetical protein [Sedimentisphaerales bacterium]
MRYLFNFMLFVVVIGLASVSLVHGASGSSVSSISISDSAAYPYDAEITGDSVYVRTGPGTAFYEWGKLYKGDKVKIMGEMDGVWSRIQPLEGSFSWISAQYVTISASDSSIGEVTGDNVRVWAGSPLYSPERSTTPQGKLSKGSKVKIIGQPVNNYYKISVPSLPDAYYWVSTQYTKPIPKQVPVVNPIVNPAVTVRPVPVADDTTTQTIPSVSPMPMPVTTGTIVDSNEIAPFEAAVEITPLDKYYVLQKQVEEERSKPIDEQDYSAIKEALLEIVNDKDAGKASIFSQAVIDRIDGIELALQVEDIVKQQNDQFNQSKENIEKAYTKKLEEVENLGKYAVIGKLQNFLILGSGNYRIVGDSDQTICYAVPNASIAGRDLSGLIGKKVGLVGTIEPHTQTSGAMVRFSEVVGLK